MNDYQIYYEFLGELRDSGITNMFGARPYLLEEFPELSSEEAQKILIS